MAINDKIKMIMASAGVNGRQLADAFKCPPQTATNKITRGIKSIDDLVIICDYCGAKITITTKDGAVIPLTFDDIKTKDAAQ